MLTIVSLFWLTIVVSQTEATGVIELEIIGMESDEGQVLIGLYNTEEAWLQKPYRGAYGKIANGVSTVVFRDIPQGFYAISVFHDKDNDGKLKKFLGVPTERYGSSNDAPSRFGPPKWQDAKFEVISGQVKQVIQIH